MAALFYSVQMSENLPQRPASGKDMNVLVIQQEALQGMGSDATVLQLNEVRLNLSVGG